jgi:hypothetical protein
MLAIKDYTQFKAVHIPQVQFRDPFLLLLKVKVKAAAAEVDVKAGRIVIDVLVNLVLVLISVV